MLPFNKFNQKKLDQLTQEIEKLPNGNFILKCLFNEKENKLITTWQITLKGSSLFRLDYSHSLTSNDNAQLSLSIEKGHLFCLSKIDINGRFYPLLKEKLIDLTHQCLKLSTKNLINLNPKVEIKEISPSESRALEWLKSSFRVLTDALLNINNDHKNLFLIELYSGEFLQKSTMEPQHLFRLKLFNLDFELINKNQTLFAQAYDKKNNENFEYQNPILEASLKGLAPQFLDEFIKLHPLISNALIGQY